jgi:hypothetical protein
MPKRKGNLSDPAFDGVDFSSPPYVCQRCKYSTDKISSMKRHLKKEVPCKKKTYKFSCDCLEGFDDMREYNTHQKKCVFLKKKTIIHNEKNISVNNGTQQIGNNNTTIINNQEIKIGRKYFVLQSYSLPYKYNCLNADDCEKLFDDKYDPYLLYFKLTFCNPDMHKFHSIYYPNNNKKIAFVYNGTRWIEKNIHKITRSVIKFESRDLIHLLKNNFHAKGFISKEIKNRIKEINISDSNNVDIDVIYERNELQKQIKELLFTCSSFIKETYEQTNEMDNDGVTFDRHNYSSESSPQQNISHESSSDDSHKKSNGSSSKKKISKKYKSSESSSNDSHQKSKSNGSNSKKKISKKYKSSESSSNDSHQKSRSSESSSDYSKKKKLPLKKDKSINFCDLKISTGSSSSY